MQCRVGDNYILVILRLCSGHFWRKEEGFESVSGSQSPRITASEGFAILSENCQILENPTQFDSDLGSEVLANCVVPPSQKRFG